MRTVLRLWRKTLGGFFLLACSYAPVGWAGWVDEERVPDNLALVYVVRDDAGSPGDAPVYLDGEYIEALPASTYLKLAVVPGPHAISTTATGPAALPLTATTDSRLYLKLQVEAEGTPQLSLLTATEGEQLLAGNRPLRNQVFVTDASSVDAGNQEAGGTDQEQPPPAAASDRGMRRLSPEMNAEIARASNQVSFGYGKLHQDYREFNDGLVPVLPAILDSETGSIDSVRLAYIGVFSRVYVQLNLNYSRGTTDYVGYLQAPGPVYTPFNTTTRNTMYDLIERAGYTFKAGDSMVVVPYIELGEYFWSRKIGVTTIYYGGAEEYSHLSLGAGAKLLYTPVRRLVVEVGAGGGYVLLAAMTTHGYDYKLGEKPYISGYASLDYRFVASWHLKASADYRKWQYGQSGIVGGAVEPHSESVQTQYLLSLGYDFW